jgi:hypothetical protein
MPHFFIKPLLNLNVDIFRISAYSSTFAKKLELQLKNAIIIDQDNHASFINAYYKFLRPKEGPNTLKYAVTQTIVDYAVNQIVYHLVLCNSNLARKGRMDLLDYFRPNLYILIKM